MKLLQLIKCSCLIFTIAQAQTLLANYSKSSLSGAQNGHVRLQLTTSIVKQCYNFEVNPASLNWTLKLTYTNIGHQPILLDKKSSVIYKSIVSRSLKKAVAQKYEYGLSSSFLDVRRAGTHTETDPSEDAFVTLKPGESYGLETDYGVLLSDGTRDSKDYLHSGNHLLQLRVTTWYYLDLPETYRERWRDKGYLWSQNMTSLPMPFTVEKQRNVRPCSL